MKILSKSKSAFLFFVAVCFQVVQGYTWHLYNGLPYTVWVEIETVSAGNQKRKNKISPFAWGEFKFGGFHAGTCFKKIKVRKPGGYWKEIKNHKRLFKTTSAWKDSRCKGGRGLLHTQEWIIYSAAGGGEEFDIAANEAIYGFTKFNRDQYLEDQENKRKDKKLEKCAKSGDEKKCLERERLLLHKEKRDAQKRFRGDPRGYDDWYRKRIREIREEIRENPARAKAYGLRQYARK